MISRGLDATRMTKDKLRTYALGPVRLDLELPDLSVGALDYLLGHGLEGGSFYCAWARPEEGEGRFVYGFDAVSFGERWCCCTGRGERLELRWVVFDAPAPAPKPIPASTPTSDGDLAFEQRVLRGLR